MTFPAKLLGPGEDIYLDARPNWSLLFWPSVLLVAAIAFAIMIVVAWSGAPTFIGWVLLAIVAVAAVIFLAWLGKWAVTSFVVTSQRIIYRTGVLRRIGREIPIGRVQDVTYRQNIIERIVGAGRLTVESAGRAGREPFPDIRHPAEVQALINRLVTHATNPAPAAPREYSPSVTPLEPTPAVPAPVAGATVAEQLEQLAELHRHGVITDAEYEAKRSELVDRL